MVKVSVYITAYNYGKYLKQAINSVLNQRFDDFELIVVDDASTDNTKKVLKEFEGHPKIKIIYQKENKGLVKSCIDSINASEGKYIIRLDADDYFDENALLVMSNILDMHPEIGLVYPDYFEVSENGEVINHVRRKKINEEVKLLDLPAHGACTMVRKKCYNELKGYSEDIKCQDGYDLWIKFINKFQPYNVNLPLFYYRQHGGNLTTQSKKILTTRKIIKDKFVKEKLKDKTLDVLAIVPTRGSSVIYPDLPIKDLAGEPLLSYILKEAVKTDMLTKVVFTTEDDKVAKIAKKYGAEIIKRPLELGKPNTPIEPTILFILNELKKKGFVPDIVVVLFVTSPLIKSEHITEAINTLIVYDADSVISVREDLGFHYKHGMHGLESLSNKRLRLEKEMLYEQTGGIMVSKKEVINKDNFLGQRVSHVILAEDESIDINSRFDFWLVEQLIKNKELINKL
jgi:CMP-N-acetylneuraminic acid synthetase